MRSLSVASFAVFFSVTCFSVSLVAGDNLSVAIAEEAPDVMLKAVVAKIKETGNPAEIVDHVDWDEAFKQMPEPDKFQLRIKTAEDMKSFFRDMLESPSKAMKRNMLERVEALPADKQAEAKVAIEKLADRLKDKEAELKQRVKETNYEVGEPKIKGDTATVLLTQVYKGERKEEKIELRKKNGVWKLPSIKMGQAATEAKAKAAANAKAVVNPAPTAAAAPAPTATDPSTTSVGSAPAETAPTEKSAAAPQ